MINKLQVGSDAAEPKLIKLNRLIESYQKSDKTTLTAKNCLDNIVLSCDNYILSIPKMLRAHNPRSCAPPFEECYKRYPHIEEVLMLQKQAVQLRLNFEQGKTAAQVRWGRLRNLQTAGRSSNRYKTKALEPYYWAEATFKGKMYIYEWCNNASRLHRYQRLCYQEICQLETQFQKERLQCVQYLQDPSDYKLDVKDGLFYSYGRPFSTRHSDAIFVVDNKGNIYCDPENKISMNHSSFLSGCPVLCAGSMLIKNGVLHRIILNSGHYRPSRIHLYHFLTLLNQKNVDLKKVVVAEFNGQFRQADLYLKTQGYCLSIDEHLRINLVELTNLAINAISSDLCFQSGKKQQMLTELKKELLDESDFNCLLAIDYLKRLLSVCFYRRFVFSKHTSTGVMIVQCLNQEKYTKLRSLIVGSADRKCTYKEFEGYALGQSISVK